MKPRLLHNRGNKLSEEKNMTNPQKLEKCAIVYVSTPSGWDREIVEEISPKDNLSTRNDFPGQHTLEDRSFEDIINSGDMDFMEVASHYMRSGSARAFLYGGQSLSEEAFTTKIKY